MNLKKYFLIIVTLLFIVSCNKNEDNECIKHKISYVTSVNSQTTGMVNETINIEVNFGVSNGCGGFGKFIETGNGNSRIIEVEAKYIGCICTHNAPIRTTNYEFITSNPGDYELKFKSSPTEYIIINLTIS